MAHIDEKGLTYRFRQASSGHTDKRSHPDQPNGFFETGVEEGECSSICCLDVVSPRPWVIGVNFGAYGCK